MYAGCASPLEPTSPADTRQRNPSDGHILRRANRDRFGRVHKYLWSSTGNLYPFGRNRPIRKLRLAAGFEVTMTDEEVYGGVVGALLLEVTGEIFDDRHGAMPTAGATYPQGEVRLTLGRVAGN